MRDFLFSQRSVPTVTLPRPTSLSTPRSSGPAPPTAPVRYAFWWHWEPPNWIYKVAPKSNKNRWIKTSEHHLNPLN